MCIKKIPTFGLCGHSAGNDPNLTYIETDDCLTKDCENPREQTEYRPDEQCFECAGVEPFKDRRDGPAVYFKHCFQSEICDHEYEHMLTDIERDPFDQEVVLVTPIPFDICPECKANGFDRRPGGNNPPPMTASIMPRDYEGLPRASIVSVAPGASTRPSAKNVPSSTYNPGVSRIPSSSKHPIESPEYATYAQSAQSSSSKAPTMIYSSASPPPPKASTTQPGMTAADYLARGVPKNVAASAFYDNPDGADAKTRLETATIRPSSRPPTATRSPPTAKHPVSKPPFDSRTQAPPAEGPNLDSAELTSGARVPPSRARAPSSSQHPTRPAPAPSSAPSSSPSSQHPNTAPNYPSSSRPSERPTPSRAPQPGRAPSGNSVYPRNSAAPRPTAPSLPPQGSSSSSSSSSSLSPSSASAPRVINTELPLYKTMAGVQSAFPSQPPPGYKGGSRMARPGEGGGGRVSTIPEEK